MKPGLRLRAAEPVASTVRQDEVFLARESCDERDRRPFLLSWNGSAHSPDRTLR